MLELHFQALSEARPGAKWQTLFNTHWPAYRAWYVSKDTASRPDYSTSLAQLKRAMPEMLPTFERFCELAGADDLTARFLTGYRPPAYITGCSQAVWGKDQPQLVRNYDYHPHLSEGTLLHSTWHGRQVIAVGDSLWGAVDGMNEDGLAASLTFGGRRVVGDGFGIPFILRYVLEFCSTVSDAVEALRRIPSHMAYNVTVLDRSGAFRTVRLAPDHRPVVTDAALATNHQGGIDWPEHAAFSQTVERAEFLQRILARHSQDAEGVAEAFLEAPLYNTRFNDGFGTVYTAVYRPGEGRMELRWPGRRWRQSFEDFQEGVKPIRYTEQAQVPTSAAAAQPDTDTAWAAYGKAWAEPSELAKNIVKTFIDTMGIAGSAKADELLDAFACESKRRGQIPWEMLADIWSDLATAHRPHQAQTEAQT